MIKGFLTQAQSLRMAKRTAKQRARRERYEKEQNILKHRQISKRIKTIKPTQEEKKSWWQRIRGK